MLALAVGAAAVLVGRPVGLGLVVLLFALGLIGGVAATRERRTVVPALDLRLAGAAAEPGRRDGWRIVWWALAAALACLPLLRAAGWVLLPAVAMAAALASLAVAGGARWGELAAGLRASVSRMPRGIAFTGQAAAAGVSFRAAGPMARGAALTAVLLAVFVPLLVSADAAFAEVLRSALPSGWAVGRPLGRVMVALAVAAAGGALLHAGLRPPAPLSAPRASAWAGSTGRCHSASWWRCWPRSSRSS